MSCLCPKYIKIFFLLIIISFAYPGSSQILRKEKWVDSVFSTLTPDERIAQLLMVRGYSNRDSVYNNELVNLVSNYKIGGVCFFQGGPVRQALLTNRIQESSNVPVFIAIDGEWGLGMRLDSTFSFPKQMTLGAIRSDQYIYEMGREIARQMHRVGIHLNFAPVVDINNNPENPVINARSFGEDRMRVAEKSYFYMKGMQDEGLIAIAKHFPGHGDTDTDSHYSLPIIPKSRATIDSLELFPFKYLIDRGIKGIMVSHLRVPALDTSQNSIATLSEPILKGLLRKELGFKGMIITDGMDMKGLVDYSDFGKVEADALKAGNDILLLPVDAKRAISNICQAIDEGYITQQLVDEKCRQVLEWKYEAGLNKLKPIVIENLLNDLTSRESKQLALMTNARAITLLSNKNHIIPIKNLDTNNIACLVIGDTTNTAFQFAVSQYAPARMFNLPKEATRFEFDSIARQLEPYNLIIAAFSRSSDLPSKRFNITEVAASFIDSLSIRKRLILNLFASPYSLRYFKNATNYDGLILSYQDNNLMQELTAQAIFGGRVINGQLPVSADYRFNTGDGLQSKDVLRLAFGMPEEVNIAYNDLLPIDSIVYDAIDQQVFPGAQVLVIKQGKVILNKAYGTKTYDSFIPVRTDDIYDLASLTKVLGTTMMAMKLSEEKVINIDRKLSYYNEALVKSNKKDATIKEIMAHEARFQSYIPFHSGLQTDTTQGLSELLAKHYSIAYPNRIADGLYGSQELADNIIDSIISSQMLIKKGYRYSDLGFILLARTFETLTDQPMTSYLDKNIYNKLGLTTMGFHPRDRFGLERIAPTEFDKTFRRQVIHGDVHDQTAALLGGVAGHAGLFSDAVDVGIMLQMILNNGSYGGEQIFDSVTVAKFTGYQFPGRGNRRGAGFDKPPLKADDPSPACSFVSSSSYGHSGFTGTYFWVDPEEELIYVFLSNRVFPDAENTKITRLNIRTKIHEQIYKAIKKGQPNGFAYNQ